MPVTFDENGVPIPGTENTNDVPEVIAPPAAEETEADEDGTEDAPAEGATPAARPEGKYRIGDRAFDRMEDALAFAEQQERNPESEVDAYRKLINDVITQPQQTQSVTQPAAEDVVDETEFYANPTAAVAKAAERKAQQAIAELEHKYAVRDHGNAIWNEFTGRHPALADFRQETEAFVEANTKTVQDMVKTKGKAAAYDYIALKLKSQFQRYAEAAKPKRDLPNGGARTTPTNRAPGVTPKEPVKKPSSFVEQMRSIKKR